MRPMEAGTWRDVLLRVDVELAESSASTMDKMRCALNLARVELLLYKPEKATEQMKGVCGMLDGMPQAMQAEARILYGQALAELGRQASRPRTSCSRGRGAWSSRRPPATPPTRG